MLSENQIFIVVDVETDGHSPGQNSMLSLGAVACDEHQILGEFYKKLLPLPDAIQDDSTMKWWSSEPEAWQEVNTDQRDPSAVMNDFQIWVDSFDKQAIFVSYPASFDYSFVGWYLHKFASRDPFRIEESGGPRTLDVKSYAAGLLRRKFNEAGKHKLPDELKQGMPPHTHKSIDDARSMAVLLQNLVRASLE